MNKRKRIWIPIMAVAVAVSTVPPVNMTGDHFCNIAKAKETEIDGMRIVDGVLTKYNGNAADVVIPDGVVSIADYAFEYNNNIENVTIPESVEKIGEYAFRQCSVKTVKIEGTIEKMAWGAFTHCEKLESIDLSKVKELECAAFSYCGNLKEVDLSSAQIIDASAFRHAGITSVKLNLTEADSRIGESAFEFCENLEKVEIKGKITRLESGLFSACKSLTDIQIENTGDLNYIGQKVFEGTPWQKEQLEKSENKMLIINHILVKYKPNVFYAGEYGEYTYEDAPAFVEEGRFIMQEEDFTYTAPSNAKMETVTIPANITQIAGDAFYGAYSVEKVAFDPDIKQIEIGDRAFDFTTWQLKYMEKEDFMVIGGNLIKIKCNAKDIEVPNGVRKIVGNVFMNNCAGGKLPSEETVTVENITLPRTVQEVGDPFFATYCITAPNSLKSKFQYRPEGSVVYKDMDTSLDAKDLLPGYEAPKPTPSADVTATPQATATVEPSTTPQATATAEPSATPQATKTVEPSATPKVTATLYPTKTPQVTATPKITATPNVTSKPQPTVTPTVTPTANATKVPVPTATPKQTPQPAPTQNGTEAPASLQPTATLPVSSPTMIPDTAQPTPTVVPTATPVQTPKPTAKPRVKVKKAVIKKAKKLSNTKAKIYMKKVEKVKGYQIFVSTNKKFKKNLKKVNTTKQSVVIRNLKKGKKYYVKVRAYKLNSGKKKVYGPYSNIKKIRM